MYTNLSLKCLLVFLDILASFQVELGRVFKNGNPPVTLGAQKTSVLPGGMVVVNVKSTLEIARRSATNLAAEILVGKHFVVFLQGDTILPLKGILSPSALPTFFFGFHTLYFLIVRFCISTFTREILMYYKGLSASFLG